MRLLFVHCNDDFESEAIKDTKKDDIGLLEPPDEQEQKQEDM